MSNDLRAYLSRLADISLKYCKRSLYVQEREKVDSWIVWNGDDKPYFHVGVLPCQVLFESDDPPMNKPEGWTAQRSEYLKLMAYLESKGIPFECAYGGNKSTHLSVFFDPSTAFDARLRGVDLTNVDIYQAAREVIWRTLPKGAGVSMNFDKSNVRFTMDKRGRMVRLYGSKRPKALPKTWLGNTIPEIRPTSDEWQVPPDVKLWDASSLRDAIFEEVEQAAEQAEYRVAVDETLVEYVKGDWKRLLGNIPWLQNSALWDKGSREPHATMALRAMVTAGLTAEATRAELKKLESHVREKDYDFEEAWYSKVDRFYREGRKLDYVDGTLAEEARFSAELDSLGLKPLSMNEISKASCETPEGCSPSPDGMPDIGGSNPMLPAPELDETTPIQELAVDIELDEIPRTGPIAPPLTPETSKFMEDLVKARDKEVQKVYPFNDDGNAERLMYRYGDNFRFIWMGDAKGKFAVWDGTRWRFDDGGFMLNLAKSTARLIIREQDLLTGKENIKNLRKWNDQSGNDSRLKGMLQVARTHSTEIIKFDADPWMLNVQNGVINLRTETFRPHSRDDLMMSIMGTIYDPNATCPKFFAFLEKVLPDPEIREHLQRFVGYSLTGNMRERVFRVDWGQLARNGKSSLYRTLRKLFGDYSMTVNYDVFNVKRAGTTRNDIAAMVGKRLIMAIESYSEFALDVNLIKSVTGGDEQQARFLFKEFFNFYPQCKLFMASNNKATIIEGNNAIWDRMHLVEWKVRITDEEEIKDFAEIELFPELSGILNWALDGCKKWQESGLVIPNEVKVAVAQYREEQYILHDFIDEQCDVGEFEERFGVIFDRYKAWAIMSDIRKPLGSKGFANALRERFAYRTLDGRPIYRGIKVRSL